MRDSHSAGRRLIPPRLDQRRRATFGFAASDLGRALPGREQPRQPADAMAQRPSVRSSAKRLIPRRRGRLVNTRSGRGGGRTRSGMAGYCPHRAMGSTRGCGSTSPPPNSKSSIWRFAAPRGAAPAVITLYVEWVLSENRSAAPARHQPRTGHRRCRIQRVPRRVRGSRGVLDLCGDSRRTLTGDRTEFIGATLARVARRTSRTGSGHWRSLDPAKRFRSASLEPNEERTRSAAQRSRGHDQRRRSAPAARRRHHRGVRRRQNLNGCSGTVR